MSNCHDSHAFIEFQCSPSMLLNADSLNSLLSLFTAIFKSDALEALFKTAVNLWRSSRFRGSYIVESHQSVLELKDGQGHIAVYSKQQRMKFIQDNVFAVQDQAWGDGHIFADYQCSPGVIADFYKEGYRYKIVISLRSTRNKGDTENLRIERMIEDGFTTPTGNFQTQIDHPTQALSLSIIFPHSRPPRSVALTEQNAHRSMHAGSGNIQHLADGRTEYHWHIKKPRLYEGYILRWEW